MREPLSKKTRLEMRTFLLHLLFANLVDEQFTDVNLSDMKLTTDDDSPWELKCCFPAVEEDLLLYLAILGEWRYQSYYDQGCRKNFSTSISSLPKM